MVAVRHEGPKNIESFRNKCKFHIIGPSESHDETLCLAAHSALEDLNHHRLSRLSSLVATSHSLLSPATACTAACVQITLILLKNDPK